jgi:hypothetical protein
MLGVEMSGMDEISGLGEMAGMDDTIAFARADSLLIDSGVK